MTKSQSHAYESDICKVVSSKTCSPLTSTGYTPYALSKAQLYLEILAYHIITRLYRK